MNIQDAIKSNKPFKRKGLDDLNYITMPAIYRYSMDEILADDWEIQEKTISITESQFDEAWDRMWDKEKDVGQSILKKELGF